MSGLLNTTAPYGPSLAAKAVLDLASYVSIAVSLLGLALSVSLLLSIWVTRAHKHKTQSPLLCPAPASIQIDKTIVSILAVITVYSVLILIENVLWIVDWSLLHSVPILSLAGYALVFSLFSLNIQLAFDRQYLVNVAYHSAHFPNVFQVAVFVVSRKSLRIFCLYGVPLVLYCFYIASFALSIPQNWLFLPFSTPESSSKSVNCLFLIGMSYFPIAATITCCIYVYTYTITMQSLHMQLTDIAADRETGLPTASSSAIMKGASLKRAVILRCLLMSIGLIVFYVPTIAGVFTRVFDYDKDAAYPDENLWLWFWLNVLPAFDCIWTPILVLWFQEQYREDFFNNLSMLIYPEP
ncbi:hypothetical protein BDR26DRAFT_1016189 [Obelidium mucronatum]|nr:hypothetical protein BDR26DRAFT_1016189 [Obelidium mucronatum]